MEHNYQGLPAAATVEQAIVLAQLIILRDLERQARQSPEPSKSVDPEKRAAA